MAHDTGYYVLPPNSVLISIATHQRRIMYRRFVKLLAVNRETTILDVGATSDRTYASSNYLEAWHPYSDRITTLGLADASFLCEQHPGLTFIRGNALMLPFGDKSFDVVHCSAVIEHVGVFGNQAQLVTECAR